MIPPLKDFVIIIFLIWDKESSENNSKHVDRLGWLEIVCSGALKHAALMFLLLTDLIISCIDNQDLIGDGINCASRNTSLCKTTSIYEQENYRAGSGDLPFTRKPFASFIFNW